MSDKNKPESHFIEVLKVVAEKGSSVNIESVKETINVKDISTIREWHKGRNDDNISGDMTQVIVWRDRSNSGYNVVPEGFDPIKFNRPTRTFLIEENYEDFKYRLSKKAILKDLEQKLYDVK